MLKKWGGGGEICRAGPIKKGVQGANRRLFLSLDQKRRSPPRQIDGNEKERGWLWVEIGGRGRSQGTCTRDRPGGLFHADHDFLDAVWQSILFCQCVIPHMLNEFRCF